MPETEASFGQVLNEAGSLFGKNGIFLVIVAAAITAAYSAFGLMGAPATDVVIGLVVSIWVQYRVLERLLIDRIERDTREYGRRYGSVFGVGILTGFGILLGTLLLVLPGIYLAARWFTANCYVVAKGSPTIEAIGQAWDATGAVKLTMILVVILSAVPIVAMLGVLIGAGAAVDETLDVGTSLAVNGLTGISSVLGWLLAAAAYRVTVPAANQFEEVFG